MKADNFQSLSITNTSGSLRGSLTKNKCLSLLFTFYLFSNTYKRLKISARTALVVAVPPISGVNNFPSSKLASTAA